MESKKYSLFYDKDDEKLVNCLNKGDCSYFSNFCDDKPGLIPIGDFNNIDEAKNLCGAYMEACSMYLLKGSREYFDSFINNFDDCDNGYFYIDGTKEKVYLSNVENKYGIHLKENSNLIEEFVVSDLTRLFRKDRYGKYYIPFACNVDCSDVESGSRISFEKLYNDGSINESWRFEITLDKNDGVLCCIFDPQGYKRAVDNFLDIKTVRSASEYYCQEGLLRFINYAIDTGAITKR